MLLPTLDWTLLGARGPLFQGVFVLVWDRMEGEWRVLIVWIKVSMFRWLRLIRTLLNAGYSVTPKCGHPEIRTPLVYWTLRLVTMQYKHVIISPLKSGHLSNQDTSLIRTPL